MSRKQISTFSTFSISLFLFLYFFHYICIVFEFHQWSNKVIIECLKLLEYSLFFNSIHESCIILSTDFAIKRERKRWVRQVEEVDEEKRMEVSLKWRAAVVPETSVWDHFGFFGQLHESVVLVDKCTVWIHGHTCGRSSEGRRQEWQTWKGCMWCRRKSLQAKKSSDHFLFQPKWRKWSSRLWTSHKLASESGTKESDERTASSSKMIHFWILSHHRPSRYPVSNCFLFTMKKKSWENDTREGRRDEILSIECSWENDMRREEEREEEGKKGRNVVNRIGKNGSNKKRNFLTWIPILDHGWCVTWNKIEFHAVVGLCCINIWKTWLIHSCIDFWLKLFFFSSRNESVHFGVDYFFFDVVGWNHETVLSNLSLRILELEFEEKIESKMTRRRQEEDGLNLSQLEVKIREWNPIPFEWKMWTRKISNVLLYFCFLSCYLRRFLRLLSFFFLFLSFFLCLLSSPFTKYSVQYHKCTGFKDVLCHTEKKKKSN